MRLPGFSLNSGQAQILRAWRGLCRKFLGEQWRPVLLGYALGILLGGMIAFCRENPELLRRSFVDPYLTPVKSALKPYASYLIYLKLAVVPLAILLLFGLYLRIRRVLNSWIHGITTGSCLLSIVIAAAILRTRSDHLITNAVVAFGWTLAVVALLFGLQLIGAVLRARELAINVLNTRRENRHAYVIHDPEAPIDSLAEDTLGRAPLIEILALKILVAKAPVIAVRGNFGDGKSSLLNMLREQIEDNCIVVSFSTWLPDSHKTLVTDLLGDISTEIARTYFAPELRKGLNAFSSMLSDSVRYLKLLPAIIPPYTQRQEMLDLQDRLSRLPKRVVVLLDEIDRMQKEELLTLLKVIRGSSSLPNITFVCAFQQQQMEETACGAFNAASTEFMEKFFPVAIDLPEIRPDALQPLLADQLWRGFCQAGWRSTETLRDDFNKRFQLLWDAGLDRLCTNLRKISLLSNDVQAVAVLIKDEVDPVDLCAIEALRRFHPRVHEIVWRNAIFFSHSFEWWKSRQHRTDEELVNVKEKIRETLQGASAPGESSVVSSILKFMFPQRIQELSSGLPSRNEGGFDESEKRKGISHPDYFWIYFYRTVSDAMFSSHELNKIVSEVSATREERERRAIVARVFDSFERNSLREFDFLSKLPAMVEAESLPIEAACSIAYAIAENADKLSDEMLVSEVRTGLAVVFTAAQRLSGTAEIDPFLAGCLAASATDLFAMRLYAFTTEKRANNNVLRADARINESALKAAFLERMDSRYGPSVGLIDRELGPWEASALYFWSKMGEAERQKVVQFWERYVNASRSRLADAFNAIAPINSLWNAQSAGYVEQMFPIEKLRKLYDELPANDTLNSTQERSLRRLKAFLDGELKPGLDLWSLE